MKFSSIDVKKFFNLVCYFFKYTTNKNQNCKSKQIISGKGYLSIFVAQTTDI